MGERQSHESGEEGLLSVLCNYDGALGWSCFYIIYRRWAHGRSPWQKRTETIEILYNRWRLPCTFIRGWSPWRGSIEDRKEGSSQTGQDASCRYRERTSHIRWGDQREVCACQAIWWVGRQQSCSSRWSEDPEHQSSGVHRWGEGKASESIWLHLRGFQEHHISYGRERCGGHQCHGYRHTAGSPFEQPQATVQLLQAVICTGYKSSYRCDQRGSCHIHIGISRKGRQHPWREAGELPCAEDQPSNTDKYRSSEDQEYECTWT